MSLAVKRGALIVFEDCDRSGKSTQVEHTQVEQQQVVEQQPVQVEQQQVQVEQQQVQVEQQAEAQAAEPHAGDRRPEQAPILVGEEPPARRVVREREYPPEVLTLAESLSAVFPSTPLAYLKYRSEDLVGRDAAIARLTDELLENPRPPEGWAEAASEEVEEKVAGPSGGSPAARQSPVRVWERWERWEQLQSMFPVVCPDHLLALVTAITGEQRVGEEVTGADNSGFQQVVEGLWAPRTPPPTRKQW